VWSFDNDPEFQPELDWIDSFVRERVQPLDYVLGSQWNIHDPEFIRLVRPLQAEVKARGLWACHLGPELGGPGYGQLKLALMNEKFGMSRFGPIVFGCQAPDTGNSEILAHYGTPEQKEKYLVPLLNNDIVSCFSMTEPQGGADPLAFTSTAVLDGDEWVVNGEKWFASEAESAAFYIMMVVTEPDEPNPYRRASMLIIPTDTPGIEIVANHGFYGEVENTHAYLRLTDVRVPADSILGARGQAFVVAQVRLSGGRMHHAMRTLAQATRAFEMMCERVVSRETKGRRLGDLQMVQEQIADSWVELRQFRLLILRDRVVGRPGQGLEGDPQERLGREGRHAQADEQHRLTGASAARLARHQPRDAVRRVGHQLLPRRARRRADRGPQAGRGQGGSQGRHAEHRAVPVLHAQHPASPGLRALRPVAGRVRPRPGSPRQPQRVKGHPGRRPGADHTPAPGRALTDS
jgi:acyl-CoA dehydrogenase